MNDEHFNPSQFQFQFKTFNLTLIFPFRYNDTMQKIVLFFLLTFIFAQGTFARQYYTMEDLKILAEEKSDQTYLDHALDIRPSQRGNEWNQLTSTVAFRYIETAIHKKLFNALEQDTINTVAKWPLFEKNGLYHTARTNFFMALLRNPKRAIEVMESLKKVPITPLDDQLRLFTKLYGPLSLDVTSYLLGPALKNELSSFYCQKPLIQNAIYELLQTSTLKLHTNCIQALTPTLKKNLIHQQGIIRDLSYHLLDRHKLITTEDKDLYLTYYFLSSNGAKGILLNASWNQLEKLAENYERRQKLLKKLLKISPLPDRIIKEAKTPLKEKLLSHLNTNFPEYLKEYSNVCLTYLNGKTQKKGNPTPSCHTLFKKAKRLNLLPEKQIKRYTESTHF